MALGSCYICIKYALFTYNFLFLLTGAGALAIGILMLNDAQINNLILGPNDLLGEDKEAYLLIAIGVSVMLISFCGCIGALTENRCLLATFTVFMFVILSVLLSGGIVLFASTTSVKSTIESKLKLAMKHKENSQAARLLIDFIQSKFGCCGENRHDGGLKFQQICNIEAHLKPCYNPLTEHYTKVVKTVSGIAIAIAIVSLTGIVMSAILFLAVREQRELEQRGAEPVKPKQQEQRRPVSSADTTPAVVDASSLPPVDTEV